MSGINKNYYRVSSIRFALDGMRRSIHYARQPHFLEVEAVALPVILLHRVEYPLVYVIHVV